MHCNYHDATSTGDLSNSCKITSSERKLDKMPLYFEFTSERVVSKCTRSNYEKIVTTIQPQSKSNDLCPAVETVI